MQNTQEQIYFNFSYYALKLLGKGLYSNAWTAIAELVANSLDAKAASVKIFINMSNKASSTIEIFDNGYGMGYQDLAEKYVLIGRNRRNDNDIDEKTKQGLMGRKGIGKLAALYLSNRIYLISKTGVENSAWRLDLTEISDSDVPSLKRESLDNIEIESHAEWSKCMTGTMIRLMNVDLTNIGIWTIEGLKARLADFYLLDNLRSKIEIAVMNYEAEPILFYPVTKSIAFKNFYAFYNNSGIDPVLSTDVYIKSTVPFIDEARWPVKTFNISDFHGTAGKRRFMKENGELTVNELPYEMIGWIGIHTSILRDDAIKNDPEYLKNKAYRPNQLRLYVRKKLAVEDFLINVKNTQVFSSYIEGEISFDILDNDELGDIATTDRQGFTEDDERVQLLVDILKPIISALIISRVNIGTRINAEENEYHAAQRRKDEEAREEAEREKERAETDNERLKHELESKTSNLGSEKKRAATLFRAMSRDQVDFEKKLHMIKINHDTIRSIINKIVMKHDRGGFSEQYAWDNIKRISYCNERIRAVLEYGATANFDTKEEKITTDLFQFVDEYCQSILRNNYEVGINTNIVDSIEYVRTFSPQDVAVIFENMVNNSVKHKASEITINMYDSNGYYCFDIIDDGQGMNIYIDDVDELFEFGKGYTQTGSGIGLYHVKAIIEDMNGMVMINEYRENGFELNVRFKR